MQLAVFDKSVDGSILATAQPHVKMLKLRIIVGNQMKHHRNVLDGN